MAQLTTPTMPNPSTNILRGFYLTVAAIPLGFALYKFSLSDDGQPFFTRMIQKYSDFQESFAERNALHTRVMEQAAHDRNLFVNSQGSGYVDLNFPEQFNTGSPFSVPAGHSADLTELIAFYHKKSADNEARKVEKLRARAENSTK
ncbi:MAG: hypothetical protein LQ342_004850 [Letrouitia transgressa]|nr:MAG: hypothetical protein LQ342_004850 [Letrouitia transgressa]